MIFLLFSSCDKARDLPENDGTFVRYTQDISMPSSVLGRNVLFSVYLPDEYVKNPSASYGVVYLLHGYGDDNNAWNDQYLQVSSLINSLEASGAISPMIYVMPQGFNSYYVNKYDGSFNYMDMFVDELVPYIDSTYRTIPDREHRAVVGYSMGGFGAMVLPSMNPAVFSVAVPLSMSFRTDDQYTTESASGWDSQWGSIFGGAGLLGEARLTDYYKSLCPFHFFTATSAASFADIHYYLDCGDDEEQLSVGNDELHILMRDLGIQHEYRVRDGAHTSVYWRTAMEDVLPFIEHCFNDITYSDEDTLIVGNTFSATYERRVIDGAEASVFLPAGYDPMVADTYPVLYLAHDGWTVPEEQAVMSLLDDVQTAVPFVLIAVNQTLLSDKPFMEWALTAEAVYRTGGSAAKRIGLGTGQGGKWLFDATTGSGSPMAFLFLFDAALDQTTVTPSQETGYYIDMTDQGTYYKGANVLYLSCRTNSVTHEYRVRNGLDSFQSFLSGLQQVKSSLTTNLKN